MTHRARGLGMVAVGLPVTSEATYTLLRSFHSTVSVPCENRPHSLPMRKLGLMKKGGRSRPKRLGFPYQESQLLSGGNSGREGTSDGIVVATKILLFTDHPYAREPDSYKKIGLREGAVVYVSGATRRSQASKKRCGP